MQHWLITMERITEYARSSPAFHVLTSCINSVYGHMAWIWHVYIFILLRTTGNFWKIGGENMSTKASQFNLMPKIMTYLFCPYMHVSVADRCNQNFLLTGSGEGQRTVSLTWERGGYRSSGGQLVQQELSARESCPSKNKWEKAT